MFHYNQTRRYCNKDYWTWDPKITTLPGLYILTTFLFRSFQMVSGVEMNNICTIGNMRGVSTVLGLVNLYLLYKIISQRSKTARVDYRSVLKAISISSTPFLFFYNFLYYTDIGSLTCVLCMLYFQAQKRTFVSALFGIFSILFRQTNAIWILFSLSTYTMDLYYAKNRKHTKGFNQCLDLVSILGELLKIAYFILTHLLQLVKKVYTYILAIIAFIYFIYWNGGITVGDRDAHTAFFHFPQIVYFICVAGTFLMPYLLDKTVVYEYLENIKNILSLEKPLLQVFSNPRNKLLRRILSLAVDIATILLYLLAIKYYTYAHPYILADNRHYVFYVWRLYTKLPFIKYLTLLPVHCFVWMVTRKLRSHTPRNTKVNRSGIRELCWLLIFVVSTCLTIIPSPLLEPRYFIIPTTILSIEIVSKTLHTRSALISLLIYSLINFITLYVFLYKPYTWNNELEPIARFMW